MSGILAKFDNQDEEILLELLEGKSQSEKVRKVIEFIKAEYQEAEQDPSNVEHDLDEYLQTINFNRDGLFNNQEYQNDMFGGKRRKNRRKTKRRIQKKTKRRIQKKKAKRTHKKKSKNTKSRR